MNSLQTKGNELAIRQKKYFNMIIFRDLVMISEKMLYIKKTYEIKMCGTNWTGAIPWLE